MFDESRYLQGTLKFFDIEPLQPGYKSTKAKYQGIEFRSILESLYAAMFNMCKMDFLYEQYTFELPKILQFAPCKYTPDFYLPQQDIFIEVKGAAMSAKEYTKVVGLADLLQGTKTWVIVLRYNRAVRSLDYYARNSEVKLFYGDLAIGGGGGIMRREVFFQRCTMCGQFIFLKKSHPLCHFCKV